MQWWWENIHHESKIFFSVSFPNWIELNLHYGSNQISNGYFFCNSINIFMWTGPEEHISCEQTRSHRMAEAIHRIFMCDMLSIIFMSLYVKFNTFLSRKNSIWNYQIRIFDWKFFWITKNWNRFNYLLELKLNLNLISNPSLIQINFNVESF